MDCEITIDNKPFIYQLQGNFFWGHDEVLYDSSNNVISKVKWENNGFSLLELLTDEEYTALIHAMNHIIKRIFDTLSIKYDNKNFNLAHYHHYVNSDLHQKVIANTRFLTYRDLEIDINPIIHRISNELNCEVCIENPLLEKEIVILRISRPHTLDINPPHRDGYLDIWKHTLNLWLPLIGCDKNSSLPIIPKSHFWNEKHIFRTHSQGASINGNSYHVPGIAQTHFGLDMIRPNPTLKQGLLFTPFLIHGSAVNWNEDSTRFSLEIRLFNKSKLNLEKQ